jgi:hypothetical protein
MSASEVDLSSATNASNVSFAHQLLLDGRTRSAAPSLKANFAVNGTPSPSAPAPPAKPSNSRD